MTQIDSGLPMAAVLSSGGPLGYRGHFCGDRASDGPAGAPFCRLPTHLWGARQRVVPRQRPVEPPSLRGHGERRRLHGCVFSGVGMTKRAYRLDHRTTGERGRRQQGCGGHVLIFRPQIHIFSNGTFVSRTSRLDAWPQLGTIPSSTNCTREGHFHNQFSQYLRSMP